MSKPSRPASYVRLSTRLLCGRAFPCSSSKYRHRASKSLFSKYRPRTWKELDRACLSTTVLFRRRSHAPLTLVAIRACSSPCAALRRSARLSRGCSLYPTKCPRYAVVLCGDPEFASFTHFHPAWVQADKSAEPKVQRLLRSAPIASRRRCPLKPWGPFGGNGRGPRRKYFRWGNLGGTRRRGLNNISMSEDGSPFQARGRSPGGEGGSHSHVRGRQLIFYLRTRRSL